MIGVKVTDKNGPAISFHQVCDADEIMLMLILTKALGTGPLSTAIRKGKIKQAELDAAIASMSRLNKLPQNIHEKFSLHAATDVTGFGLIGHVAEMARGAKSHIEIDTSRIPFLPAAKTYINQGYCTKGVARNLDYVKDILEIKSGSDKQSPEIQIVCDSETSGGLLIALPEAQSQDLIKVLQDNGHAEASHVATLRSSADATKISI